MELTSLDFKALVLQGIPNELPPAKEYEAAINHAPKRKAILNPEEKKLASQKCIALF
jgi:urocanate hydratase